MESQPYLPRLISVVTIYCVHLQYYITSAGSSESSQLSSSCQGRWHAPAGQPVSTVHHTLYRKSDLCIPRNDTARPRFQFLHSCICERFIHSQDRSAYLAAQFHFWEYINRNQTFILDSHRPFIWSAVQSTHLQGHSPPAKLGWTSCRSNTCSFK
jgi:hypothetical protein